MERRGWRELHAAIGIDELSLTAEHVCFELAGEFGFASIPAANVITCCKMQTAERTHIITPVPCLKPPTNSPLYLQSRHQNSSTQRKQDAALVFVLVATAAAALSKAVDEVALDATAICSYITAKYIALLHTLLGREKRRQRGRNKHTSPLHSDDPPPNRLRRLSR
jgi:hypothetical protein